MVKYTNDNLLEADVETLVNTVNSAGVMGKGIALQFKQAFPANFAAYARAAKRGEIVPGKVFVYETGLFTHPRYILNFPTKRHWRGKARLEDIEAVCRIWCVSSRSGKSAPSPFRPRAVALAAWTGRKSTRLSSPHWRLCLMCRPGCVPPLRSLR
jgi:O-acetyl-ADP-ribose deacetylase (regulator of RNase III)